MSPSQPHVSFSAATSHVVVCVVCVVAGILGAASPTRAQESSLAAVVRDALQHSPAVQHQAWQVDAQRGALVSTRGALDPRLLFSAANDHSQQLHASTAPDAAGLLSKTTALTTRSRVGLRKPFASGLFVEPFLSLERSHAATAAGTSLLHTSLGLSAVYPFGRGRSVIPARRRAARHRLDAESLHARFVATEVAYETTRRYWTYAAAHRQVEIVAASVERARRLLHDTRMLVERDEKPAADLTPLRATLANRQAQRIGAERNRDAAREALRIVQGKPLAPSAPAPLPTSRFPTVPSDLDARLVSPEPFVALALDRRTDLAAQKHRRTAAAHDRAAATDARRPRLDVSLDVNYAGLGTGGNVQTYISPFAQDVQGLNATLRLTSDLSFRNRTARGALHRQRARYRQRDLAVRDLERTVAISVTTTVALLKGSAHQLRRARDAVTLYRQIIDDEETKYRMGTATLFGVIEAEDRLTQALTSYVNTQSEYAGLVARLRFQTQTLLSFDAPRPAVVSRRLTTLPHPSPSP